MVYDLRVPPETAPPSFSELEVFFALFWQKITS
jgi:hypothetical protein